MTVLNLGYVILSSPDLPAWRKFGFEAIGAMNASMDDGAVAMKIDEHPFRILVERGDPEQLTAMGWEMASQQAVAVMRDRLLAAGMEVREGSPTEAARRCVTGFISATDPAGNPLEFYHGRTGVGGAFNSPAGVAVFVTGEMGLGHVVVPGVNDMEETRDFYCKVVGLAQSDDLTITLPDERMPQIRIHFLHAENPRHHSLALGSLPSPTGVIHLMLEMRDFDDVGRCLDRVLAGGWKLMASLGRHCNDNMLSFYVVGPGGITFEIGCEGLQLDWDEFEPTVSTVPDHWGHAYQIAPQT